MKKKCKKPRCPMCGFLLKIVKHLDFFVCVKCLGQYTREFLIDQGVIS
jgi:ribosomal protein S27AE